MSCFVRLLLLISFVPSLFGASRLPVSNEKGLVASTSPIASEIGAEILRKGGTAADAAVAVGFALAVSWPAAGNLGGGGFALVHTPDGKNNFIDYRETAPQKAGSDFYLDGKGEVDPEASRIGYRALGVPGTVAGLALLHKKYGRLPWKDLLEPARKLAAEGIILDDFIIRSIERSQELLNRFPETRRIFLNEGKLWKRGERFRQLDLAKSIQALQEKGAAEFYTGDLARRIVEDVRAHGGVLSLEDLGTYSAIEREPLLRSWKNYTLVTAPPPSSGGAVMLSILGMLEKDDLSKLGYGSAAYLHLLVEAMKRAFADRSQWFGDPAFVSVPLDKLLNPLYLRKRRMEIDPHKASSNVGPAELPGEKPETTHFSIRDAEGMLVSNTYTLNGNFGAGVVAKGTGILLNNEMDDFTAKPGVANMFGLKQGRRNLIAPGKRPLSSMTPSFVMEGGRVILALGSPGGPTIISSVTQVILHRLLFGMTIQEAIDAPRIHHQWLPNLVRWEPYGISPDTKAILEKRGHVFDSKPGFMGDVQALAWDPTLGLWTGGADSRLGGRVAAE